jgi:ceramide glucosyltransferase
MNMISAAVEIMLLVLIGIYFVCVVVAHILTWYYFTRYDRVYPTTGYQPPVSIIKPTKGVDQLALDNFRSFCEQDYSGEFEILFCVEERSDPAVPVIKRIIEEYPDKHVRLIFSDPQDTRSIGKLKNTIAGLAASSYDVIIFSDDDTHVPPTFLGDTVACIQHPAIGLGFSAPAYEGAENWAAALMSISVNELVLRLASMCLVGMLDGAVGTTMVTRRTVIRQIGGLEQIGRQVVDDIPLARAILKHGYQVHLLKQPARVFHARDSFTRWWSHMHRWRVIIRHYWPIKYLCMNLIDLALWWCLFYLTISFVRNGNIAPGIYLIFAVLTVSLISTALINIKFAHNTQLWRLIWVVPLYELSRLPLLVHSYLTNAILWRGRRFYIHSDCTTRVVDQGYRT